MLHQNTENTYPISAHTDATCTISVGGRLGPVWADQGDDQGRFYGRGKTDENKKSIMGVVFGAPKHQTVKFDFSSRRYVL